MVDGRHASNRIDVFHAARALVNEEPALFVIAGQQIDEMYSEESVRVDDEIPLGPGERYAVEETFEYLRLKRLTSAVHCFMYPQRHVYDNHLDFEGNDPVEKRKQSARRAILVMLAAADPDKQQAVTREMGVLANIPYEFEGDEDLPEFGGSSWISWSEEGWHEHNEPSPRVLKRLRDAIDIARHGSVQAARMSRIPSGDGRPCDEPGLNRFDETERALRDVMRYVQHFHYCVDQHRRDWHYRYDEAIRKELDAMRHDNREWWARWSGVMLRAREAIRTIDLPELADAKQAAFNGLTVIHDLYHEPVMYVDHEVPGDHIFRAAMSRGQDEVIADGKTRLNRAFEGLEQLCRGCRLYIDQPDLVLRVDETQALVVEPKAEGPAKKPISVEAATHKALAIVKKRGWPRSRGKASIRAMAEEVGCSPSTINKAINQSPSLNRLFQKADMPIKSHLERDSDQLAELITEQTKDDRSRYAL